MVGTNHQPPRLVSGARCGINSPHMSKCGTASGHVPPQQVVQEEGPGGGRVREVNIDREPEALVRSLFTGWGFRVEPGPLPPRPDETVRSSVSASLLLTSGGHDESRRTGGSFRALFPAFFPAFSIVVANSSYIPAQASLTSGVNAAPRPCSNVQSSAPPTVS